MKKPAKRGKSRASSKPAARAKIKGPRARKAAKSKAPALSGTGSKLKRVAKKAAAAAVLAAGTAAIGTALAELNPDRKAREAAAQGRPSGRGQERK